ncbi:MAG TPA: M28 family peptidase [Blastocatellia bacterium]|nr:M28 family peptidase [Blastocatellia bacterium]
MRNPRRFALAFLVSLSLLLQSSNAQRSSQDTDSIQEASIRIAGSILVGGRSMEYLRGLTEQFGGRLTGSSAHQRSAEWAAAQFRAAGISNVRLERFTIPNGWERGWAQGRVLAPFERRIHIESLGWSPSTPPSGVKGEVISIGDLSADKIKAQAGAIKGRIAMLDLASIFAEGFGGFAKLIAAIPLLKENGAAAAFVGDSEPNNVLNAFGFSWGGSVSALPLAQVGMEDAKLIQRLMKRGPVTLEFSFQDRVSGPTQVNNVIAEIPGREKPDEWIIIGAHLDSWDYGTGAQDNGTGCAMVMEAARALSAISQAGHAPRRSIRFALWGGEEQGLLGSAAYVRAHSSELGNCVAVLNTDNGAGHPKGWKVEGRADLSDAMKPISELLAGMGGDDVSLETTFDTDHGHFMLEGIPSLDLLVDMSGYGKVHHKSSDTIDKVDAHNLALGSSIIAITAYAIAERPERIARRIDHAAVGEILKKANLADFLKAVGVWN